MNNLIGAQSLNAQEAKNDIFNAICGNTIVDMVCEEDRDKLIPYIEEEIKKAEQIGAGARMYSHELKRMKAMLEEDNA